MRWRWIETNRRAAKLVIEPFINKNRAVSFKHRGIIPSALPAHDTSHLKDVHEIRVERKFNRQPDTLHMVVVQVKHIVQHSAFEYLLSPHIDRIHRQVEPTAMNAALRRHFHPR